MSKIDAQKGDLLVEFFSEEIPARFQVGSGEQLENLFVKKLVGREVSFDSCKTYTGPRHLAIIIRDIDLVQKDQLVEKRGPRLGSDEKAINGFLKSNNIGEIVSKELIYSNEKIYANLTDTNHPSGGLIISKNDNEGVCDMNQKVWNTKNIFIGGASAFPNSSYANITATILALTHRLGTYLKKIS